ncbi:ATP-binding protein [uncultured Gelidibacter sp.]|uniref:sensor histidine kinase n=1 Tax=uncultured Gelidibacter sp. TaxID=259318 RepID=UPI002603D773|nr:ATP-binding protein [uncultured Gelidibacter sp.]
MQKSVREIYLVFKGAKDAHVPVLLNVEVKQTATMTEIVCGGMEIANRNRFEKELLEAKKIAEEALNENAELIKAKNALVAHQKILESQYRKVNSLKEQQQEVFKLIAHDLQERKSIFSSNYILTKGKALPQAVVEQLHRIISFNSNMSDMLLTLLHFKELDNMELNYTEISLSEVINDAIVDSQLQNAERLVITYPEKDLSFFADNRLLMRLFKELLKNSHKERNPDAPILKIDISAIETVKNSFLELSDQYHYDKFIKITYTDNSTGFRTKFSEIIEKCVQFNKINIGLAYCKQIVEKHSGIITADSTKCKGVRYTIILPMKQPSH